MPDASLRQYRADRYRHHRLTSRLVSRGIKNFERLCAKSTENNGRRPLPPNADRLSTAAPEDKRSGNSSRRASTVQIKPGLYQNWKGYLIFVTGLEQRDGVDGVRYTFATGERTGRSEWRELSDFRKHPIGPHGPPRYRPYAQAARIVADPVTEILAVFSELYPDHDCEVAWVADLDCPGSCYFGEGWTRVVLRTDLTLAETISVLLHEMAHVATLHEPEDHGPLFYEALEKLDNAWTDRARQLARHPGITILEKKNGQS